MARHIQVLVIGSGIAGCTAALGAARSGAEVLLITSSPDLLESNTARAQGGIVVLGPGDSAELLEGDIQTAGGGVCNPAAVRHLARNGPPLVERLLVKELHVPFDHGANGDLDVTEEGAHSVPRILHAEDLTGKAIIEGLLNAVQAEPSITVRKEMFAVDLLSIPDHSVNAMDSYRSPCCAGAYALDVSTGEVLTITADQTILASGGLGQIYLHTTNPRNARGDGVAMAYRAGARLLNLEYIQFHPTALYHRDAKRFLISESMRGEGAILVDHRGRTFMDRYHPQGSLAPRDVVARAIQNEMLQTEHPCVYLDLTMKDAGWIRSRFPNIHRTCLDYGIDITSQPIPVVPAAHYSCGGIFVDLEGNTSIPNLRAVGEVSCTGLHGANRLASTSLLEGLLWGWTAGQEAAKVASGKTAGKVSIPPIRPFVPEMEPVDPALIQQDWDTLQSTMWNYVGLTRTPRRLSRAMSILRELQHEILSFYRRARPSESIIGLRNGITTALAVLFAAQRNHTSHGCHFIQEDNEHAPKDM